MNYRLNNASVTARVLLTAFAVALLPSLALGQVPVDENGEVIGEYVGVTSESDAAVSPAPAAGNEEIPLLSDVDLEELVGPVALYPDDLLAIVLPASAYPLQIVDAARFLEELENDPTLKPNPEWDDSVVALVNYPEVVELLNKDIDWTWRLGEAVVSQQADVVAAIETFRDRAYAAGNLKSDSYQNVTRDEGIIEIVPIDDDVIHVPYYEPERVVVYQPRPVYYYYPRPYPVYYYPYSSNYAFHRGYFWGVTTAFSIGWFSDSLNVYHHSYRGHPYYGHSYWNRWWYRRPTVSIYNTTYVGSNTNVTVNRYSRGDRWRPRADRRDYVDERRVTRNRHQPNRRRDVMTRSVARPNGQRARTSENVVRSNTVRAQRTVTRNNREPVQFRDRTRSEATAQQRHENQRGTVREQRQQRETANVQRRTNPTPQYRRAAPATLSRRTESAPTQRRSEPQQQARRQATQRQVSRRSEPQRQVSRRPAPQRQVSREAPKQQERSAQRSTGKKTEQRSSAGRSERRSARSR